MRHGYGADGHTSPGGRSCSACTTIGEASYGPATELCRSAVRLAGAAKYTSAGTIEFVLDKKGKPYFIEANTRIQVEHPVTEMVSGVDLIKGQILIAAGENLPLAQRDIKQNGAAIECRIYAEDPVLSKNSIAPEGGAASAQNGGRGRFA